MTLFEEVYSAWFDAEAFSIGGMVYSNHSLDDEAKEPFDIVLEAEHITRDGLIYELIVTREMIESGEWENDIYDFRMTSSDGEEFILTPLFFAGKERLVL